MVGQNSLSVRVSGNLDLRSSVDKEKKKKGSLTELLLQTWKTTPGGLRTTRGRRRRESRDPGESSQVSPSGPAHGRKHSKDEK